MKMKQLTSLTCLLFCFLFLTANAQEEVVQEPVAPTTVGPVDMAGLTVSCPAKVGGLTGIAITGLVRFTDTYADVLRKLEDTPGWESQLLNITGMSADEYDDSEILRMFNKISGIDYQVQFSLKIDNNNSITWQDHFYRSSVLKPDAALNLEQQGASDSRLFLPFSSMHLSPGQYSGNLSADVFIQPGNIPAGKHDFGTVSLNIPPSRTYIISIENLSSEAYTLCFRNGKGNWWIDDDDDDTHSNHLFTLVNGDMPELYALIANEEDAGGTSFSRKLSFPAMTNLWTQISRIDGWQEPMTSGSVTNYTTTPLLGASFPVSIRIGVFTWDSLSQLAPGCVRQMPVQEYEGDECIRLDISLYDLHLPELLRPGVIAWLQISGANFKPDDDLDIDLDGNTHEYLLGAEMSSVPYHSNAFSVSDDDSLIHIYLATDEVYETMLDIHKKFPEASLVLNIRPYVKIGTDVKLGGALQFPISTIELRDHVVEGLYKKFIIIGVVMILLVMLILFHKRK